MNRKWGWRGGVALIRRQRWRRWATAAGTRPGGKGLRPFVGSAKQMVQVPAGKRLLWALCLSNTGTQYKKEGGKSVCEEEAEGVCEEWRGSSDHRGSTRTPRLSAATLALPKNACNPPADCGDPPALRSDAAAPLYCQGGLGRKPGSGLGWGGGQAAAVAAMSLFQPWPLSSDNNCTFLIFCALLLTVVID